MSRINLNTDEVSDITIVSNHFIDNYMPTANGSYVKVYLYLLRCLNYTDTDISVSQIADRLDNTENDILRALAYWEKVKLISVQKSISNDITGITFNKLPLEPSKSIPEASFPTTSVVQQSAASQAEDVVFEKHEYSADQINQLTENEEIKFLLNVIEIYLERLLKPADIQLILYLYENIGFSTELIMYLYEYCVSKNKKNSSYIESVALAWAKEGIDTVEKAELSTAAYNKSYNAVSKAFGLNRTPGTVELQYINKWLIKYGFSIDIIVDACNRALLATGKPDFKYADKILENWSYKNVSSLKDIKRLDDEHSKTTKRVKASPPKPQSATGKYNSFPQRNYSKEDYSSMEQRLLNKK